MVAGTLQSPTQQSDIRNNMCRGNETKLASCPTNTGPLPCYSALVQCRNSSESSSNITDKNPSNVTDTKGPSNVTDTTDPSNVTDNKGPFNVTDDKDSPNVTRSQGSGGEPPTGAVVGAVIAVLVVGVGVAVLVVVIGVIWWKKKHLKSGNTRFAL